MEPEEGGMYDFIRSLTKKEGDLLCLVFNPLHYIKSDRLPASGHFYYLPWQASYNRKPIAGYKIDICEDMQSHAPAVIIFDNWKVWGYLPIERYESCVARIIADKYVAMKNNKELFVRKDILVDNSGTVGDDTAKMLPSISLGPFSSIPVVMTTGHQGYNAGLKRIGVRLETYGKKHGGVAKLKLKGPDNDEFTQEFALSELVDNRYRYFDLDSKRYTAGEISFLSGGGISAWESHNEKGDISTCISYEYADGKRRFTPGCPLY